MKEKFIKRVCIAAPLLLLSSDPLPSVRCAARLILVSLTTPTRRWRSVTLTNLLCEAELGVGGTISGSSAGDPFGSTVVVPRSRW